MTLGLIFPQTPEFVNTQQETAWSLGPPTPETLRQGASWKGCSLHWGDGGSTYAHIAFLTCAPPPQPWLLSSWAQGGALGRQPGTSVGGRLSSQGRWKLEGKAPRTRNSLSEESAERIFQSPAYFFPSRTCFTLCIWGERHF